MLSGVLISQIVARLGVSIASSITDATHFMADEFVCTRNMLEAIASGKPVVTHLWLASCGQANCFIDENNYTLRDAKKEKEFGFSMPASLTRASQDPLLEVNIYLCWHKVATCSTFQNSQEWISSGLESIGHSKYKAWERNNFVSG